MYYQIRISIDSDLSELVLAFLQELPFESFEEIDDGWYAYIAETYYSKEVEKEIVALQNRFDFTFNVERVSRIQRAEYVSDIIDSFMGKNAKDYSLVVKAYLDWARKARTRIDPDAEPAIKKAIKEYILNAEANIEL